MMEVVENWKDSCGCHGVLFEGGVRQTNWSCYTHALGLMEDTVDRHIRKYETGATRDTDENKLKYEGFISPLVEKRFAEYMHVHRRQPDGNLRAPDNWQRGIPLSDYADSLVRHVQDFRLHVDGFAAEAVSQDLEDVLCAIRFNVDGYLFEILKQKAAK